MTRQNRNMGDDDRGRTRGEAGDEPARGEYSAGGQSGGQPGRRRHGDPGRHHGQRNRLDQEDRRDEQRGRDRAGAKGPADDRHTHVVGQHITAFHQETQRYRPGRPSIQHGLPGGLGGYGRQFQPHQGESDLQSRGRPQTGQPRGDDDHDQSTVATERSGRQPPARETVPSGVQHPLGGQEGQKQTGRRGDAQTTRESAGRQAEGGPATAGRQSSVGGRFLRGPHLTAPEPSEEEPTGSDDGEFGGDGVAEDAGATVTSADEDALDQPRDPATGQFVSKD